MCILCAQSCPTLYDSMDCSPPDPSIHAIFPARILQWVATPSSRGSSQPRDRTHVSCMAGRFFTAEPPREAHFICSSAYISIPISQFIPFPLFSLLEPSVCFLHLWLSFVNKFICITFIDSTYKWYHKIFVFLWLTSLSMTISRSIHVKKYISSVEKEFLAVDTTKHRLNNHLARISHKDSFRHVFAPL